MMEADGEDLEWLILVDDQFETQRFAIADELNAAAPEHRAPEKRSAIIPTLRLEGATGHAALINGEYAEDTDWLPQLVLTNGSMFMWANAGRWCVGRRKNVGSVGCRAFVQSEPASGRPEDIPRGTMWMVNDGVNTGEFAAAECIRLMLTPSARARAQRAGRSATVRLGAYSTSADERMAAQLVAAAADKRAVAGVMVDTDNGGVWGPKSNAALHEALGAGLRPACLHLLGTLRREEDVIELAELLPAMCGLEKLVVAYSYVGLSGLRAIIAAARRCTTLHTVDVFNCGPRTERWESLGCFTQGPTSEDCALLLELHRVLKGRNEEQGGVRNEAFMDDVHGGGALLVFF